MQRSQVLRPAIQGALLGLLLIGATVANAAAYYSIGIEDSQGAGYTGVAATKVLDGSIVPSCTTTGKDMVIIWLDTARSDGLELGVQYDCAYYNDYWGYTSNYVWNEVGTNGLPPLNVYREYRIARSDTTTGQWSWQINGTSQSLLGGWDRTGVSLRAGLISTNSALTIASHRSFALLKKRYAGSFVDWAGQDGYALTNPPMCGYWPSDTAWREGENVTC